MLEEYFSFDITENGMITALPQLLPGFTPDLIKLPHCESRLASAGSPWKSTLALSQFEPDDPFCP